MHSLRQIFCVIITFALITCNSNEYKNKDLKTELSGNSISNNIILDTISVNSNKYDSACLEKFEGYFLTGRYMVSGYYELIDSLHINDSILVSIVSPKTMTPTAIDCYKDHNSENRLLLISGENYTRTFENVISNIVVGYKYIGEHIKPLENGFILESQLGQGCKFSWHIIVHYKNTDFYVDSIKLSSSCPGDSIEKRMVKIDFSKDKSLPLFKYRREFIDSLRKEYQM